MAESLYCSPETPTTLLISYTLKQNKKFKVWKKNNFLFITNEVICHMRPSPTPSNEDEAIWHLDPFHSP